MFENFLVLCLLGGLFAAFILPTILTLCIGLAKALRADDTSPRDYHGKQYWSVMEPFGR